MSATVLRAAFAVTAVIPHLACRPATDASSAAPTPFVAVIGHGEDDPLWPVIRGSAGQAYRSLGVSRPEIRIVAPPQASTAGQKALMRALIREGMTGACVQVTDPAGWAETIDAASRDGFRMATIGCAVTTELPTMHAGFDQVAIGRALADALAAALHERGNVGVIGADSRGDESIQRRRAFEKQLGVHHGVHVVHRFDCAGDPTKANELMRDTMTRFPRLNGWAILGNWPLRAWSDGAPEYANDSVIVGVDPIPDLWPLIERGTVRAMVASRYDLMIREAVLACVGNAAPTAGGPRRFNAPVVTVTRDNLAEFKSQWNGWAVEP